MSAASIVNRILSKSNVALKSQTESAASAKVLGKRVLARLKADGLPKAVSVLFASPLPATHFLYARLFQLCSSTRAIVEARKVESHLVTFNPSPPTFLLNRAIEAYGHCGCLADAKELFDEMPQRDGGSWNAMLRACSQCGRADEAIRLFRDMIREGIPANEVALACVLGSCGDALAICMCRQIHGRVLKHGFCGNVVLGSSLVDVYGKCRAMGESRRMFDEIECPNEISWNVIVRRYLEVGDLREAVILFFKMFHATIRPLNYTVSNTLIACSGMLALMEGMQIHGVATKINFEVDTVVSSSLINMYTKCGKIECARRVFEQVSFRDLISWTSIVSAYAMTGRMREARELFNEMPERNVISWNAMLAGYTRLLQWEEALDFVLSMHWTAKDIDSVTVGLMLNLCAGISDVEIGKQVHGFIYRHGFSSDIFVSNALIDMYGKCGNLKSARIWFYQMSQSRDCISWNALLNSYACHHLSEQTMTTFGEMLWETKPSKFTFGTLLAACANMGALNQGKQIHGFMIRNGYDIDTVIRGALVDMYSKCHYMLYAVLVFKEAASRDLFLWNSIILGCCHNGRGEEVLQLFEFMEEEEVKPDHITFYGVLLACLHGNHVKLGRKFFSSMSNKYCIIPRLEHYECMIELFCQCKWKNELEKFVKGMPFDPTVSMLERVFDACRKHGWSSMGAWTAERLGILYH